MAEDAFGYEFQADRDYVFGQIRSNTSLKKKILIVDDINDTGATFEWIKNDWRASCAPKNVEWDSFIWGNNVRFAVMTENLSSEFGEVNYHWHEVNKAEEDVWLVYPWELDNGID